MEAVFDLRNPSDRERIADELPVVDEIQYSITKEQFLDALDAAVDLLPQNLPLQYRYGMIPIHRTAGRIYTLVKLGLWFRSLSGCERFVSLLKGFANPTQFWDAYFEARVAAYFKSAPGIHALLFSPEVVARGRRKYPDFLVTSAVGHLLVECKQLRFSEAKVSRKFRADVQTIEEARTRSDWPEEYCLEVEFLGPQREMLSTLAPKLIAAGINVAREGGGSFEIGNLRASVRHRDTRFQTDLQRRGLHSAVVRCPGHAVSLADPRHTPLRAYRGDVDRKYLRLLRAAINDARKQLPPDQNAAICIGDMPLRVATERLDLFIKETDLPRHIRLLSLWEGNTAKMYVPEDGSKFVEQLLGTAFER